MNKTPSHQTVSLWDDFNPYEKLPNSSNTTEAIERGLPCEAVSISLSSSNLDEPRLMTVKELSRRYGLSLIAVYGLIKTDSSFPAVNVGLRKKYMIDLNRFHQWLDQRAISSRSEHTAKVETMASLRKLFKERK